MDPLPSSPPSREEFYDESFLEESHYEESYHEEPHHEEPYHKEPSLEELSPEFLRLRTWYTPDTPETGFRTVNDWYSCKVEEWLMDVEVSNDPEDLVALTPGELSRARAWLSDRFQVVKPKYQVPPPTPVASNTGKGDKYDGESDDEGTDVLDTDEGSDPEYQVKVPSRARDGKQDGSQDDGQGAAQGANQGDGHGDAQDDTQKDASDDAQDDSNEHDYDESVGEVKYKEDRVKRSSAARTATIVSEEENSIQERESSSLSGPVAEALVELGEDIAALSSTSSLGSVSDFSSRVGDNAAGVDLAGSDLGGVGLDGIGLGIGLPGSDIAGINLNNFEFVPPPLAEEKYHGGHELLDLRQIQPDYSGYYIVCPIHYQSLTEARPNYSDYYFQLMIDPHDAGTKIVIGKDCQPGTPDTNASDDYNPNEFIVDDYTPDDDIPTKVFRPRAQAPAQAMMLYLLFKGYDVKDIADEMSILDVNFLYKTESRWLKTLRVPQLWDMTEAAIDRIVPLVLAEKQWWERKIAPNGRKITRAMRIAQYRCRVIHVKRLLRKSTENYFFWRFLAYRYHCDIPGGPVIQPQDN